MSIKNISELANELTKLEGKKSEIKVGDMREALGKLCDLIHDDEGILILLGANAARRAKRRKKT